MPTCYELVRDKIKFKKLITNYLLCSTCNVIGLFVCFLCLHQAIGIQKQCSMTLKQQKPLKMLIQQWQTVKKIESDKNI